MGRPQLSQEEKRRRATARTARWRKSVIAAIPVDGPSAPALLSPHCSATPAQCTTSLAEDTRANRRMSPTIVGETIDDELDTVLSHPAAETEPARDLPAAGRPEPGHSKDDEDEKDRGEDWGEN